MASDELASLEGQATDPDAPRVLVARHLDPGTLLAGRYEVVERIGGGGMGAVYRVHDRELGETVALKVLRTHGTAAPVLREAWRQEARLARKVVHPNVGRVFDIGEAGGVLFLTMELVEGRSLRKLLSPEPPSPRAALDLSIQVASGLAAVHERGIVHRDVKPENIIVCPDGRAVLVDFGLAVTAEDSAGPSGGTPAYAAPEQARGDPVDGRADVFSMGIVAFEMFAGARPRVEPPRDDRAGAEISLPSIPRFADWPAEAQQRIEAVLRRALSPDAAQRFGDAGQLATALKEVRNLLDPVSAPVADVPRSPKSGARRWWVAIAAPLVVAAAWLWWTAGSRRETWQSAPSLRVTPFEAQNASPEVAAALTDAATAAVRARSDVALCEAPCRDSGDAVSTLRGTVVSVGGRVRVEVQLLDARGTGHPEPFDLLGEEGDVLGLTGLLRRRVADEVHLFAQARRRRLRDAEMSANETAKKALADYRGLIGPRLLQEQIPAAEPLLDAAIAADGDYVPALLERAYLRMLESGSTGGAEEDVGRALEARPGDPESVVMRCSVLQYKSQTAARPSDTMIDQAMKACAEARSVAPDSVNPLRFLARLYDLTCQDELAMAALQDALELDSSRTGDVAHHLIELALQNDKVPLADRISEQLVLFQENEAREGVRALSVKAGTIPTTEAHFKRASVLLREARWEDARVALTKELSLASPGEADEWTEAAALRGLVLLAKKGYGDVTAESRRRLEQLEKGFGQDVALGVAGTYAMIDRDAALAWIARSAADASCGAALYRATIYRLAGEPERARDEARSCRPETERERRCVDWASR